MSQQPQKKEKGIFKIFVSSTLKNLKKERKKMKDIINNINLLESIRMEAFVPSEKDAHKTSLEELCKSDIYLLLIGERYGNVIKECKIECSLKNSKCDGKISFTHCEYRTARNNNKLPICFKLSPEKKDKKLPEENEDLKKIEDFEKEVKAVYYLKPITENDLKKEVENALKENIERWISEGKLNLPEFYGRNDEMKELLESVNNNSTIFVKGIGGIGKTTLVEAFLLIKNMGGANILEVVKKIDYNRTDIGYRLARCALERREYEALDLRSLAKILEIPVRQDNETIIKNIISTLNNRNLILFIDDAHEIKDEPVFDLIGKCSNSLNKGKIILAGREDLKEISVGKIVRVEKGVKDHEFIKSVFQALGMINNWNKELSDKIMTMTSAHPLAVKIVVANLDHINPDKFADIVKNPHDEKQVNEFIGRIVKEILGEKFEKYAFLSVYRTPF